MAIRKVVSMVFPSNVRAMMRRRCAEAEGKSDVTTSTCSAVRSLLFLPASQPARDRQGARERAPTWSSSTSRMR